jgi:glycosyltransferase involved in cell wall biosynthesis
MISVIIPAYRCADTIERCVDAVLRSTLPPEEVIVVDDCSPDGTLARIEELAQRHPGVVVAAGTKRNMGPAGARNAGAAVAKGKYLFFLDSDTMVSPDALENFSRRIEEHDAVVGMYEEEPIVQSPSAWYKALLYRYLLDPGDIRPYDQFSASCAGIRKEVFDAVGGYDEWFKPGVDLENEELGYRICAQYDMVLDPSVRTSHEFPGFRKMTSTFFFRTALWVEMFTVRRKFSTTAGTSATGTSSMALLAAVLALPLGFVHPYGLAPSLAAFVYFAVGYAGFFRYVARRRPSFLPLAIPLNLFYTLVIALGAGFGLGRVLLGRSELANRFREVYDAA